MDTPFITAIVVVVLIILIGAIALLLKYQKTGIMYLMPQKPEAKPTRPACKPRPAKVVGLGWEDKYRGWYDAQGCGQKNDYCRWVGNAGTGGDPAGNLVVHKNKAGQESHWSCHSMALLPNISNPNDRPDWKRPPGQPRSHDQRPVSWKAGNKPSL